MAKKIGEVIEPVLEGAKKAAGQVSEGAKRAAEQMSEETKKVTKPAADTVKQAGQTISDKVAEVTMRSEVFVQYGDYEIKTEDMVKRSKDDFIAKGHRAAEIKDIQIYIKPTERCAYYVINHRDTGKVEF